MNPPLRTAEDRGGDAARRSPTGRSTCIVTDHAPHHYDEKEREFADAPNRHRRAGDGAWRELHVPVASGVLSLAQMVDAMSCKPARVFHLPGGTLARGSLGDISVFDPMRRWVVEPGRFKSKGRNTPYGGSALTGQARMHGRWGPCRVPRPRLT